MTVVCRATFSAPKVGDPTPQILTAASCATPAPMQVSIYQLLDSEDMKFDIPGGCFVW